MTTAPTRPIVRYHGGKWRLAEWIIKHMPVHRCYVEPFGGGGSVLLRKPHAYAEVYNDLDGEIVNVFRMARDHGPDLVRAVTLTPFSRADYALSFEPTPDPLEQARRTILRSFFGFGTNAAIGRQISPGFRNNTTRTGTIPAHDWENYPEALQKIIERLRGVVIENQDGIQVMARFDAADTLHYVDPPYLASTRQLTAAKGKGIYVHEMSDDQHAELAIYLRGLRGMVIVSGYPSPLYADLYAGWRCVTRAAHADGARPRTEALWISPNCQLNQEALL